MTMETAEKKKLTLLFSTGLQTPVVSPQSAVIGWQMLAMTRMKTTEAMKVDPMIMYIVQTNRRRASATRRRVTQIEDLIGTVQLE